MKISTQTRYALRFLLELSREPEGARLTTQHIAQTQGLSVKYLEAIAAKLRRAGFIHSIKGSGGGYLLARPPEEISVGDVAHTMETTFFEVPCCTGVPCTECAQYSRCAITDLLTEIREMLDRALGGVSVADLRDAVRNGDMHKRLPRE